MSSINTVTSVASFRKNKLPQFVRDEHPKFVSLMENYYNWMGSNNNPHYQLRQLQNIRDLDYVVNHHENGLRAQFLSGLPLTNTTQDIQSIAQHIKDFYSKRGSLQSYKFLFRYLFNSPLDLEYPKNDILRCSDGIWVETKIIRTVNTHDDEVFANAQYLVIRGESSGAEALIDRIQFLTESGVRYTEWYVYQPNGKFIVGEFVSVKIPDSDYVIREQTIPLFTGVDVLDGGEGYLYNDVISVTDTVGGETTIAEIKNTSYYKIDIKSIGRFTGETYSQLLSDVNLLNWSKTGATTDYVGIHPIWKTPITSIDGNNAVVSTTVVDVPNFLFSVYVNKSVNHNGIVKVNVSNTKYSTFNLNNTTSTNTGAGITSNIKRLSDNWYVLSVFDSNTSTRNISITTTGRLLVTAPLVCSSSTFQWFTSSTSYKNCLTYADGTKKAILTARIEALGEFEGRYDSLQSLLSQKSKIQDNHFYQEYSYVVNSTESINDYRTLIEDSVHPAGWRMYGKVLLHDNAKMAQTFRAKTDCSILIPSYKTFGNRSFNSYICKRFISNSSFSTLTGYTHHDSIPVVYIQPSDMYTQLYLNGVGPDGVYPRNVKTVVNIIFDPLIASTNPTADTTAISADNSNITSDLGKFARSNNACNLQVGLNTINNNLEASSLVTIYH